MTQDLHLYRSKDLNIRSYKINKYSDEYKLRTPKEDPSKMMSIVYSILEKQMKCEMSACYCRPEQI